MTNLLYDGIAHLTALNPDMAQFDNGVGFSKAHSARGQELAATPADAWTPEDRYDAYRILRVYKNTQLPFDFDQIDPVPCPTDEDVAAWEQANPLLVKVRKAALKAHNPKKFTSAYQMTSGAGKTKYFTGKSVFIITSPRNMGFVNAIKDGFDWKLRAFSPYPPCWEVLAVKENEAMLRTLIANFNIELTPEAQTLLDGLSVAPVAPAVNPRTLTLVNGQLVFKCPYDGKFVDAIKALPRQDRRFNDNKTWTVPATSPSVPAALAVAQSFDFDIAPDVASLVGAAEEAVRQAAEAAEAEAVRKEGNLEASAAAAADIQIEGLAREPFPFQKAGIAYALKNIAPGKGILIGDDMGLGKTTEAIATVHALDAYPCVVVCPASVKFNWVKEWNIVAPGKTSSVVNGTCTKADVVVLNYDILGKHLETLESFGFKSIIVDEAHYIKGNPKKVRRAANVLELAQNIPYKIALTGTPALNRPTELLTPLKMLNRLEDVGGWATFMYKRCKAYNSGWGMVTPKLSDLHGVDRQAYLEGLQELNRDMRSSFYVRREKGDVLTELPEKIVTLVPVEITNRKAYNAAREDIIAYCRALALADREFNATLKGMSEDEAQAARTARARDAGHKAAQAEVLVRINHLRQLAEEGKMDALREYVEGFGEAGRKVVIMGWHKKIVDGMANEFACPKISGNVDAESRQEFVDMFQNDPQTMVIACNMLAAGEGITLTAASDVVFSSLPWNPGKFDQASDRCHRIGQTNNVNIHVLVGRDTIDGDMWELIQSKRQVTAMTMSGDAVDLDVNVSDLTFLLGRLTGEGDS